MSTKSLSRMVLIAWFIAIVILLVDTKCNAQTFTEIGSYPFVVTDLDFDEEGNIFVAKQDGIVYKNADTLLSIPVWDQNEMGLVGIELDGYNLYMHVSGLDTVQRVIRYDTQTQGLDTIIEVSYKLSFSSIHRGGDIRVADSILYCSFGEGNHGENSQNLLDYRGKILAIDLTNNAVGIVGFGLRNPFRFDIDTLLNYIYIADVGSNVAEEVNYLDIETDTLLNYGWPCFEGIQSLLDPDTLCDEYEYTWPIFVYNQEQPRAIIGGTFWQNNYYYVDQYSNKGGYIDSMGFAHKMPIPMGDTIPLKFPSFVTGMAVNETIDRLVVSTWGGEIYLYEVDSIILAIPEPTDKPEVQYKARDEEKKPTIYYDIYGRMWMYPPHNILFYDPHIKKLHYIQSDKS